MNTPYRLHYAPDNASLIIRLVLEEMGQAYQTTLVDRRQGGLDADAFRTLNPNGLIPVLETQQGPLFETAAILLWLGDHHKEMVPPTEHPERGAFLKWLFFVSNTLHADLRILFYPQKYTHGDAHCQEQLSLAIQHRLKTHLKHLDSLAATGPCWLGDETPSILDYYIACLMRWICLYPFGGDRRWFVRSDYPNLNTILKRLELRTAVHAAKLAEGLGPRPFTQPRYANPPEGSAT